MRKPATERLPVGAPCLRCGPLPLFSPQQVLSAVRPSNDSLSDNATDNREVREADPSPRPRIRNGFSSPALQKTGAFKPVISVIHAKPTSVLLVIPGHLLHTSPL